MANHNASPTSYDTTDDDDDSTDSAPVIRRPAPSIDFLLNTNRQAEESAAKADEHKRLMEAIGVHKEDDKEDSSEKSKKETLTPQQVQASRTIITLSRDGRAETAAASDPAATGEDSSSQPSAETVQQEVAPETVVEAPAETTPTEVQANSPEELPVENTDIQVEAEQTTEAPVIEVAQEAEEPASETGDSEEDPPTTAASASVAAARTAVGTPNVSSPISPTSPNTGPPPASPRQAVPAAVAGVGGGGPAGVNPGGGGNPNGPGNNPNFNAPQPNQPGVPAAANQINYNTTIEQRGNAIGPAIIAFLAATYFRRRGEKRLNRKINKLDDRLETTEDQTWLDRHRAAERQRAASLQDSLQQQRLNRLERTAAAPINKAEIPLQTGAKTETVSEVSRDKNAPVKLAEVLAATEAARRTTEANKEQKAEKSTDRMTKEQIEQERIRQYQQYEFIRRQEKLKEDQEKRSGTVPQIAKAEADPAQNRLREVLTERQNEVKDDSSVLPQVEFGAHAPRVFDTGKAAPQETGQSTQPATSTTHSQPFTAGDDSAALYKKSMRAGILVGLATAVLGAIAYLLVA
jgi:hypothetical protein